MRTGYSLGLLRRRRPSREGNLWGRFPVHHSADESRDTQRTIIGTNNAVLVLLIWRTACLLSCESIGESILLRELIEIPLEWPTKYNVLVFLNGTYPLENAGIVHFDSWALTMRNPR